MYQFHAPFVIDGRFAKEVLLTISQHWTYQNVKLKNNFGEFDIRFLPELLNDETSYQYVLEVDEERVQQQLHTQQGILIIDINVLKENIQHLLSSVLAKFGVIDFGFLPTESQKETENFIRECLKKEPSLRLTESSLIISTQNYNETIKWETSSNGFYYTLSHWNNRTESLEKMEELLIPKDYKLEMSKRFHEQVQEENQSQHMKIA